MSAGPAVPGGAEGGPRGRAERLKSALRHPLTITALSALAATLLIPAFTHQWQDRQKERDLKTELATSLDELTTRAVVAARIVIERRFPEAQTTDARKEELESASKEQRAAAARAYRQAVEHERDTRAATYIQLFSDWLVTRSVVRSRLAAYFPGQDLAAGWETYANNVTYYIRLGSGTSPDAYRQASVAALAEFLGEGAALWNGLVGDPRVLDEEDYAAYVAADARLADRLLKAKNDLVRRVLDSDVAGYSTDPNELLKDLTPFYG